MSRLPATSKDALARQVVAAQARVKPDGYEMSIGELISIYERDELVIRPDYQRLFRWSLEQKSRLIESVLIGIPVPPLFVFQDTNGKWELVDGLQRVSTLLEFRGVLRTDQSSGATVAPSVLAGTNLIPALEGASWAPGSKRFEMPENLKLRLLRARIRVEILQAGSDPRSKYELFQRLNTGGSLLTHQEIRNCALVMFDKTFFEWLRELSDNEAFAYTTSLSDTQIEKQRPMELVTKFFACNFFEYKAEWDFHDYLDEAAVELALDRKFNRTTKARLFDEVFNLIRSELGETAFRRQRLGRVVGSFSDALYEAITVGVCSNLAVWRKSKKGQLQKKVEAIWSDDGFTRNTGAGVRGTTRLTKIIPFAREYFRTVA
jgi:hypothetical protein